MTELLPTIEGPLPAVMAGRRVPSAVCELLNTDSRSPFRGLIRRASQGTGRATGAVIADTSIVQMVKDSLESPSGCLFPYRNVATGEVDLEGILEVLTIYWSAVRDTFPEAWGLPPSRSRLMHGVGIRAMGRVMDRIASAAGGSEGYRPAPAVFRGELARIKPQCHWTSGAWEGLGGLAWNEIQNTPTHFRQLSNVLVRAVLQARKAVA